MNDKVLLQVEGSIATVSLNRPEVLNAFNSGVWAGLEKAALSIMAQPKINVVILTGAGDRAFSAGMDLKAVSSGAGLTGGHRRRKGFDRMWAEKQIFTMYETLSVPVIAAINGYCLGAGLELILCSDIRLAAEHAIFGLPEVDIRAIPDMGGTQRLPRLVGSGHAKELIYTACRIDAAEALRIGLVDHIYPREQLMAEARRLAEEIASKDPAAVQAAKNAINVATTPGLEEGLRYETALALSTQGMGSKLAEAAAELYKKI